jgi:cytochrome P450
MNLSPVPTTNYPPHVPSELALDFVHGKIGGRPITDEETMSICQVLLGGGLDTVVTMTSFMARHLARHSEDRKTLREHPELIPGAVEEFARCFGTTNIGREVKQDIVYKGLTRCARADLHSTATRPTRRHRRHTAAVAWPPPSQITPRELGAMPSCAFNGTP